MSFGLTESELSRIEGVFLRFPAIEKVVLYGSRAKGIHRPGSDIDIVLLGDGLDDSLVTGLENELDDLLLPYRFDLSILSKLSHAELIAHISRGGAFLFERSRVGA